MANKKSTLRNLIILGIFIALAVGVALMAGRNRERGLRVTSTEIKRGEITSLVTATGRVFPELQVIISSEVPGEIVELPVRDGQRVNRGDLLVRVNPDTLAAQVKQQEASLAAARASSASQRATLLQAKLDLQRVEDLAGRGFTSPSELDQARTRVEAARASHESSLHQIERQEMQLLEARDQLAKASLFAPINGTVVRLNAEIGDRVVGTGQFAGTEIMRLANLESMQVRVEVSEVDIVNVVIGQRATIEVDALPREEFKGHVAEIANSAVTIDARSQEQQTTFQVRIQLDDPGLRLRPGMTATADIQTESVKDVVKAPLGSVVVRPKRDLQEFFPEEAAAAEDAATDEAPREQRENGGSRRNRVDDRVRVVFVHEAGKAQLRIVETGIADRNFIEIKSGLEAGAEIITGPYRALTRELAHHADVVIEKESNRRPAAR